MSSMDLPRRNGQAVEQALRQMTERLGEQQRRIDGLVNTISSLALRMDQLEQAMARQRISALGNGPTA